MREILFRGKLDERIDEWIEGSIWHDSNSSTHIIGYRYWGEMSKDDLLDIDLISWKVIPETVGQYTGLTDKNGKKIFEGDICKVTVFTCEGEDKHFLCEVCFDYSSFIFRERSGLDILFSDIYDFKTDVEVIGNIYDNPELEVTND